MANNGNITNSETTINNERTYWVSGTDNGIFYSCSKRIDTDGSLAAEGITVNSYPYVFNAPPETYIKPQFDWSHQTWVDVGAKGLADKVLTVQDDIKNIQNTATDLETQLKTNTQTVQEHDKAIKDVQADTTNAQMQIDCIKIPITATTYVEQASNAKAIKDIVGVQDADSVKKSASTLFEINDSLYVPLADMFYNIWKTIDKKGVAAFVVAGGLSQDGYKKVTGEDYNPDDWKDLNFNDYVQELLINLSSSHAKNEAVADKAQAKAADSKVTAQDLTKSTKKAKASKRTTKNK